MYRYVNLKHKNDFGLVGIAYNDNKDTYRNTLDFSAIFKHDDYYSIVINSLYVPKTYKEDKIISTIIANMNYGSFEMGGCSIAGNKQQIELELQQISGLDIKF